MDFGFDRLSLNEKEIITVPVKAKGLIIGKGGETVKSIMAKSGARVTGARDRDDPTFTITGSSESVKVAKSEIENIVKTFKEKSSRPRDQNNNQPRKCGGKLPKNWLYCPPTGVSLIDDFILPGRVLII